MRARFGKGQRGPRPRMPGMQSQWCQDENDASLLSHNRETTEREKKQRDQGGHIPYLRLPHLLSSSYHCYS